MAPFNNLDDHCLEKICEYLNFIDLLNLADTNQRLKRVTEAIFQRSYSGKLININTFFLFNTLEPSQSETCWSENFDNVCALKSTLQFIRCFGHLITKFEVQYTNICSKRDMISRYISQFCSDSLKVIKFYDIKESDFDDINQPFTKVKDVEFVDCRVGKNLSRFHSWFPKMQSLILSCSDLAEPINIATHFSSLQNLSLSGFTEPNYFKNIIAAFRLNPQLKRLELGSFFKDAKFIQYISKYLQNLNSLKINWDLNSVCNLENEVISFKNVKEFKLCLYRNKPLPQLPFWFEQLEGFVLKTGCKLNHNFIDFLLKHSEITRLSLIGLGDSQDINNVNTNNKTLIAKTLPWLEKLYLINYEMSVAEADQFLRRFETLDTFLFTLDDGTKANLEYLNWFMGSQWNVSTVGYRSNTNPIIKLKRNNGENVLNLNI